MRAAALLGLTVLAGCDIVFDLQRGPAAAAAYSMDGLDGDTLPDDTGHRHDGSCTACPVPIDGVHGGALAFDGTELVRIPDAPVFDPTLGMTAALWVSPSPASSVTDTTCPFGKNLANSNGENSWQICLIGPNTPVVYAATTAGGVALTAPALAVAGWHHLALRWDGTTLQLFVDGQRTDSEPGLLLFDGGEVTIGGDVDVGQPIALFPGAIDEVVFYDRAVTDAELVELARP